MFFGFLPSLGLAFWGFLHGPSWHFSEFPGFNAVHADQDLRQISNFFGISHFRSYDPSGTFCGCHGCSRSRELICYFLHELIPLTRQIRSYHYLAFTGLTWKKLGDLTHLPQHLCSDRSHLLCSIDRTLDQTSYLSFLVGIMGPVEI